MKTVQATYAGGVFHPRTPVPLPERCEVEFEPRVIAPAPPDEDARRQLALAAAGSLSGPRDLSAREGFGP